MASNIPPGFSSALSPSSEDLIRSYKHNLAGKITTEALGKLARYTFGLFAPADREASLLPPIDLDESVVLAYEAVGKKDEDEDEIVIVDQRSANNTLPPSTRYPQPFGLCQEVLQTLVRGLWTGSIYRPIDLSVCPWYSDDLQNALTTLNNPGAELTAQIFSYFFSGFSPPKKPCLTVIHNFYLTDHASLKNYSYEDAIKIITKVIASKPLHPICIPLVVDPETPINRPHLTVILIKDGQIEYYDPLGESSGCHFFKNNKTLGTLLKNLGQAHQLTVVENCYPHQWDANNCGVLVLRYIYSRIVEKSPIGQVDLFQPTLDDIRKFREKIKAIILEYFDRMRSS